MRKKALCVWPYICNLQGPCATWDLCEELLLFLPIEFCLKTWLHGERGRENEQRGLNWEDRGYGWNWHRKDELSRIRIFLLWRWDSGRWKCSIYKRDIHGSLSRWNQRMHRQALKWMLIQYINKQNYFLFECHLIFNYYIYVLLLFLLLFFKKKVKKWNFKGDRSVNGNGTTFKAIRKRGNVEQRSANPMNVCGLSLKCVIGTDAVNGVITWRSTVEVSVS